MTTATILSLFILLSFVRHLVGEVLAWLNYVYFSDRSRLQAAAKQLGIDMADISKALSYAQDKFKFSRVYGNAAFVVSTTFIAIGGLGILQRLAELLTSNFSGGVLFTGLGFFLLISLISYVVNLPAELYYTFIIEQKHGFNKQTPSHFFADQLKSALLSAVLGGLLLVLVMSAIGYFTTTWWLWVWLSITLFSLLMAWLFPVVLAPLFNKFSPLDDVDLRGHIERLTKRVGFKSAGVFVMDASKRSTHANAYFTGVFGAKRIVLFDTLLKNLSRDEIVAVLAHELGHFSLQHIRQRMIFGIIMSGMALYVASWFAYDERLYQAFGFSGFSAYAAITVFALWSSLFSFLTQPLSTYWSRMHEFEADRYAKSVLDGRYEDLAAALKKLRATSQGLPLVHPLYSAMYYSHPPLIERLAALRQTA